MSFLSNSNEPFEAKVLSFENRETLEVITIPRIIRVEALKDAELTLSAPSSMKRSNLHEWKLISPEVKNHRFRMPPVNGPK